MNVERMDLAESQMNNLELSQSEPGIPTTREVLEELYELLEDYAPAWYTERHHKRAVAALVGRFD
jgi:septation ring formation regulator EzrA